MKEKNLNPGEDQNQAGNEGQKSTGAQEQSHNNDDQQGSYTDEYDNYSPWG